MQLKNSFPIQLDESVFDVCAILLVYVRYFSNMRGQLIDELLLPTYLETDGIQVTDYILTRIFK